LLYSEHGVNINPNVTLMSRVGASISTNKKNHLPRRLTFWFFIV
jgi:hypothetical protein